MGNLVIAVWDGFHALSILITLAVLATNGGVYGVLRAAQAQLFASNQRGTAYADRCRALRLGIVVRTVAHLCLIFVAVISLTQGNSVVALLPQEVLWSYLVPILTAYNLFIAAIGLLSALALQGAINLYSEIVSSS